MNTPKPRQRVSTTGALSAEDKERLIENLNIEGEFLFDWFSADAQFLNSHQPSSSL